MQARRHASLSPPFSFLLLYLSQRILKLAVPNLFVWILGFYAFFHLYLNILAELLRFDDRLFYKDWWNCTTVVRIIVSIASCLARPTYFFFISW